MDKDTFADHGALPAAGRALRDPGSDDSEITKDQARGKQGCGGPGMRAWKFGALTWAVLISAAARSEPAAAWLAIGTIAIAPLALVILVTRAPARSGFIIAVDAEALAWSQPTLPPGPPRKGSAAPVRVRRRVAMYGIGGTLLQRHRSI